MHDLDLDHGLRSNADMIIERKYMYNFLYDDNCNVSRLLAFARYSQLKMNDPSHTLDLLNGPRSYVYIPIESPYATSYLMEIVMFALYLTTCKKIMIITFEFPKYFHS